MWLPPGNRGPMCSSSERCSRRLPGHSFPSPFLLPSILDDEDIRPPSGGQRIFLLPLPLFSPNLPLNTCIGGSPTLGIQEGAKGTKHGSPLCQRVTTCPSSTLHLIQQRAPLKRSACPFPCHLSSPSPCTAMSLPGKGVGQITSLFF